MPRQWHGVASAWFQVERELSGSESWPLARRRKRPSWFRERVSGGEERKKRKMKTERSISGCGFFVCTATLLLHYDCLFGCFGHTMRERWVPLVSFWRSGFSDTSWVVMPLLDFDRDTHYPHFKSKQYAFQFHSHYCSTILILTFFQLSHYLFFQL